MAPGTAPQPLALVAGAISFNRNMMHSCTRRRWAGAAFFGAAKTQLRPWERLFCSSSNEQTQHEPQAVSALLAVLLLSSASLSLVNSLCQAGVRVQGQTSECSDTSLYYVPLMSWSGPVVSAPLLTNPVSRRASAGVVVSAVNTHSASIPRRSSYGPNEQQSIYLPD